jgi:hypothetical protein
MVIGQVSVVARARALNLNPVRLAPGLQYTGVRVEYSGAQVEYVLPESRFSPLDSYALGRNLYKKAVSAILMRLKCET